MTDHIVEIAPDFWNIRGTFKVALLNIGTQMSLARLKSGGFALLDSYALTGDLKDAVFRATDGGRAVEAILNLHPFHTLHVRAVARAFPEARLYGTKRHVTRDPDLRWEPITTEDPALQEKFADDFTLTVPRGVDFVSKNEHLHFSSVLALHRASRTLHVDDTLTWADIPLFRGLRFHPSLKRVLQPRAGAVDEFLDWTNELVQLFEGVDRLCTAHMAALPPQDISLQDQLHSAIERIQDTLTRHRQRYG